MDTVFRQALRAEAQTSQKGHYAIILWDLKEYYEHIDRKLLLGRAGRSGYPMYLMKPALEMYKKVRWTSYAGMVDFAGHSNKGIPAGDGQATFMIQAYAMEDMDAFMVRATSLRSGMWLDTFVDDFALSGAEANQSVLISDIKKSALDLHDVIVNDIKATVSEPKANIVTTAEAIRRSLRRSLKSLGVRKYKVLRMWALIAWLGNALSTSGWTS